MAIVVLWVTAIYAFAGGSSAYAVMGESAENRGLVISDDKGTLLIACQLGGACVESGEFFRQMAVAQINRGGPLEQGLEEITGIGFGSLISTAAAGVQTDIFCWTGTVSYYELGKKECVSLTLGVGVPASAGDIIEARVDSGTECADAETLFGKPPLTFDYLVKFDEFAYGGPNAVDVVTCAGTGAAEFSPASEVLQAAVTVNTFRGMAAYDAKLLGGLYCCRK